MVDYNGNQHNRQAGRAFNRAPPESKNQEEMMPAAKKPVKTTKKTVAKKTTGKSATKGKSAPKKPAAKKPAAKKPAAKKK